MCLDTSLKGNNLKILSIINQRDVSSPEVTNGLKLMNDGTTIISGLSSGGFYINDFTDPSNPQHVSNNGFGF